MDQATDFDFLIPSAPPRDANRDAINASYHGDEDALVEQLLAEAALDTEARRRVQVRAAELVAAVRARKAQGGSLPTKISARRRRSQGSDFSVCARLALRV